MTLYSTEHAFLLVPVVFGVCCLFVLWLHRVCRIVGIPEYIQLLQVRTPSSCWWCTGLGCGTLDRQQTANLLRPTINGGCCFGDICLRCCRDAMVPTTGEMKDLIEALKACSSETQRLVTAQVLQVPAVQHMLLVFLSDQSRYCHRHSKPIVVLRLVVLDPKFFLVFAGSVLRSIKKCCGRLVCVCWLR